MATKDILLMIDMDGVVSDFDAHFLEIYGKSMNEMTGKEKSRFWDVECVSRRFFANAPVIYGGRGFVDHVERAGFALSFLTSTGGGLHHVDIAKQKLDFLQRHGMGHHPVAFATGTKCKASFARPGVVLVDDRKKVVDAFRGAGGEAHLFVPEDWYSLAIEITGKAE